MVGPEQIVVDQRFARLINDFADRGGTVLQFLPINLLSLLEWRANQGMSYRAFDVGLFKPKDQPYPLLAVQFRGDRYPHVRLVGPAAQLGLMELNNVHVLEIGELTFDVATEAWLACAFTFLQVLWR